MKRSSIFFKVFVYTIIFSTLLAGATAALFLQQLISYYSHLRIQEISRSYQRIADQYQGESDVGELAKRLYERHSFEFYITDKDGSIVYKTPDADISGIEIGLPSQGNTNSTIAVYLTRDYTLRALRNDIFEVDYDKWLKRALVVFAAMLVVCIMASLIFAKHMTKPIKMLVDCTKRMANMEEVPPPPERKDELGLLAHDVYSMYDKLKETISKLEYEVLRERELEEAQRYFFSAASHELKTPIAATSALLEGMLENVGDYKNHPKYLRECMKMMDAQSKVISEMLEIVNLSNRTIVPVSEKLSIRNIISDMLPDFQILSEANDQQIIMDIPEGEDCLVDSKMLRRVLSNILLNAVQNTPRGGEIRIWSEAVDEQIRLCIENTGTRIDDEALLKLFEPFYRIDKARSRQEGRSGLGLTIVRKMLEAMKVDFGLENTSDGVLFWMILPKS